jgi:hypothetical protein
MFQVVNCYLTSPVAPVELAAHGALADNGSTNTAPLVPYPIGIANGDIAILNVSSTDAAGTVHVIDTPSGWTQIDQVTTGGHSYWRHAVFWKRLDGTETGTVALSRTPSHGGTDCFAGVMSAIRGCIASGTPYEGLQHNGGSSVNMAGAAVTTLGPDRQVLHFCTCVGAALSAPASDWDEIYDLLTTSGSNNGGLKCYGREAPSAGSVATATHTLASSLSWQVMALALIPA